MSRLRLIVWLMTAAFLAACCILYLRERHSRSPFYRRLPSGRLVPAPPVAVHIPAAVPHSTSHDKLKALFDAQDLGALQDEGRRLGALEPLAALAALDEFCPGWDKRGGLTGKSSIFLRAVLGAWAAKDPPAAAQWTAGRLKTGGDLSFALHLVAWRWTESDADAALAWANGLSPAQGRECALRSIFAALAARDSALAAKQLEEVRDFKTGSLALGAIAAYWAKQDARSALAWAWKLPPGQGRNYALANVALELFKSDRDAAASLLEKLPATNIRREAMDLIAAEWARIDPEGAAARLGTRLPAGRTLHAASQVAIWNLALKDPVAIAAWAVESPDQRVADAKTRMLAAIAKSAAKSDSPAADLLQAVARQTTGSSSDQTKTTGMTSGGGSGTTSDAGDGTGSGGATQTDGANTDGQNGEGEGDSNSAVTESSFPASFFSDRSLAVLLMEQLPDGDARNGIMHLLAVQWAREDPLAAITWAVEQVPIGRARDNTLQVLMWNWTQTDRAAAIEWAASQPDQNVRESAMVSIAQSMASVDPAAAAAFVARLPAGEKTFTAIDSIAFRWASQDMTAATAWAQALAAEQGRDCALFQVGAGRARHDLATALEWANQLPEGAARDNAVAGAAYIMVQSDPGRARSIAEGLADGVGRQRVLAALQSR